MRADSWDRPGEAERLSPSASEPLETGKLVVVPLAIGNHYKARTSALASMAPTSAGMVPVHAEAVEAVEAVEDCLVHAHRVDGSFPEPPGDGEFVPKSPIES